MTRPSLKHLSAALLAALAISLLPATLFAEEEKSSEEGVTEETDGETKEKAPEDPWDDALSADHPGFSDSSATVNKKAFQGEFGIDLAASYMVGDKVSDIECGWNAGVKCSVLVRTGYGREHESQLGEATKPLAIFETLDDFADLALGQAE